MARKEKVEKVKELTEKMETAESIIFTNYRGLNVAEINELRSKLREAGVEYQVIKNTLANFAAENAKIEGLKEVFVGPTAAAFGQDDPVTPAKVLTDFSKDHKELVIKGGVLDGNVIAAEKVEQLAKIPSREELIAKALGSMQAPINGFACVLAGIPRKLL